MKKLVLLVCCLLTHILPAATRSSITQYSITWTFDKAYETGQYANGDWWVLGPVVISDIDPKGQYDGSMVNVVPNTVQGLADVSPLKYDAAKNISLQLPYSIDSAATILSTTSQTDWDLNKCNFTNFAVLTVVTEIPDSGSFRPPYAETSKDIPAGWHKDSLDYSVLKKLNLQDSSLTPDKSWVESAMQRPLLDVVHQWPNSTFKSADGDAYPRRCYGREVANISTMAGMYLNLDLPDVEKEKALINMVQWGIDVYGLRKAGMAWHSNGGHNGGRKLPLFVAAMALNDADMKRYCSGSTMGGFHEDMQHFLVEQNEIDTPRNPATNEPYTAAHLGMPEWVSAPWEKQGASPDWHVSGYRQVNGGNDCGAVLVAMLMDGRLIWDREPYFRYIIDRYYPRESPYASYGVNSVKPPTRDLWTTYFGSLCSGTGFTGVPESLAMADDDSVTVTDTATVTLIPVNVPERTGLTVTDDAGWLTVDVTWEDAPNPDSVWAVEHVHLLHTADLSGLPYGTYTANVTLAYGEFTRTWPVTLARIQVGIENGRTGDLQAAGIQAGPNPMEGPLTINVETRHVASLRLIVYDQFGTMIYHQARPENYRTLRWDGTGHEPGIYYYRITAENKNYTGRIIKTR